jgi:hypothetical protein
MGASVVAFSVIRENCESSYPAFRVVSVTGCAGPPRISGVPDMCLWRAHRLTALREGPGEPRPQSARLAWQVQHG